MPFTSLESDVKERLKLELAPCTIIIGRNKAYKTAILDAIRLALTGKHPIGPHPSDMLELAADPKQGIHVSLQGPSGQANFDLPVSGDAAKKPIWEFEGQLQKLTKEQRDRIVPSEAVKDLLGFGPARAREAVLKRFGPKGTTVATPPGLDDAQLEMWKKAVKACEDEYGKDSPAATILAGVAAWMRRAKGSKGDEANDLERRLNEARAVMNEEAAGAENLAVLKAQRDKAVAWEKNAADRHRLKYLKDELEPLAGRVAAFEAQKTALQLDHEAKLRELVLTRDALAEKAAKTAATLAEQRERLIIGAHLVDTFGKAIAHAHDPTKAECPYCFSQNVDLKERRDNFALRTEARRTAVDEAQREHDLMQTALAAASRAITEAESAFTKELLYLTESMGTLKTQDASLRGRVQEIESRLSAEYVGPPSAELTAQIERIEGALTVKGSIEDAARELRTLRRASEDAKTLEKEAMQLADGALKHAAAAAADTITKYMPKGEACAVRVDEKHWEWCIIGEDKKPHREHGASGMEWASLALALPQAWTEGNPLRVAIYDDRDIGTFDAEKLHVFCAALKAAVDRGDLTQAIVVWNRPKEILDGPPAGWHVIHRDRDHVSV